MDAISKTRKKIKGEGDFKRCAWPPPAFRMCICNSQKCRSRPNDGVPSRVWHLSRGRRHLVISNGETCAEQWPQRREGTRRGRQITSVRASFRNGRRRCTFRRRREKHAWQCGQFRLLSQVDKMWTTSTTGKWKRTNHIKAIVRFLQCAIKKARMNNGQWKLLPSVHYTRHQQAKKKGAMQEFKSFKW